MSYESFGLLNAIIESVADGILVVDNHGKVLHYNSVYQKMWDISDDLVKKGFCEEYFEHLKKQHKQPSNFKRNLNLVTEDQTVVLNDILELSNGSFIHRYTRPLLLNGVYTGRLWKFTDVTEVKKTQETFQAVTSLSPDIVTILNSKGEMVFNSAAAERIHGYNMEDLSGKNTLELIHPDDRDDVAKAMERLVNDPSYLPNVQYRYLNKDGSYIWMEACASNQLQNPSIHGLIVISRDISERKKLEQDLQEAIVVRDEFLSVVSHELKTPVTSIKLRLQMIERNKKKGLAASEKDIWGLIEQVNAVQRLIGDLQYVTKIKSGQLELDLQKENLSELVEQSLTNHQFMLIDAGIECKLNADPSLFVYCDKIRLQQVITNIISNAAKYAPNGPVDISVYREQNQAVICLKDHGKGISKELQKTMFELFSRGHESSYLPGLGIGLFISRNIINQHNGTLDVESEPGKGASFLVRLPIMS